MSVLAGGRICPEELAKADVVVTTYPVVEREWRVCVDKVKVPCQYCGRRLLERTLRAHNKVRRARSTCAHPHWGTLLLRQRRL
eukprot:SAG25_NODE_6256_length_574_cov_1.069474_2_plen_82_part_01